MQHSHSRLQTSYPPTLYLLPLHPYHRHMFLAVSLYLLFLLPLPDSLRVFQWNAGDLEARSTGLQHFLSSHPVYLICIQKSNLNASFFLRPLDFLLCDLIAATPVLIFFLLISQTLAAASSFLSGRAILL